MKTHVCVGSLEDVELIVKAARLKNEACWIVPKTARPNDRALVYVHGIGVLASAEVQSNPRPCKEWGDGWYEAELGNVQMIEPVITLEELQKEMPGWGWTIYPRSYTTPRPEIQRKLLEYIEAR